MKTSKQSKAQRIIELERKLRESEAGQVFQYHFADAAIHKASTEYLEGSGVIITLTVLGGREIVSPLLIRDGLSIETIEALRSDIRRSYKSVSEFKPKGV